MRRAAGGKRNALIIRGMVIVLPIWLMGYDERAGQRHPLLPTTRTTKPDRDVAVMPTGCAHGEITMSDNEGWRRRKAEELGLVDAGPFRALRATTPAQDSAAVRNPTSMRPLSGNSDQARTVERGREPPAATSAGPEWHRSDAQATRMLALLAGLALALVLGWWLRGAIAPANAPEATLNSRAASSGAGTSSVRERSMPDIPPAAVADLPASPAVVPESAPARIPEAIKPPPRQAVVPAAAAPPARKGRFTAPRAVAAPGRNFRPSFNCRRATSWVNRTVCTDRKLAAMDVRMSNAYGRAIASAGPAGERRIDAAQTRFLNQRARCPTMACIDRAYRTRIKQLDRSR